MPNYSFKNLEDGNEYEMFMSISEKEKYLEENKNKIIQLITKAPGLSDPVSLGVKKPSNGFRDVLREVKKHHPRGGGVNTF